MKNLRKLFAMTVMLLLLIAATVRGQAVLDGFDPNANGIVYVVVVNRTARFLSGATSARLAEWCSDGHAQPNCPPKPDGTLDTAFDPNVNEPHTAQVTGIAVQADGKILVSGVFTSVGGQMRNNIAPGSMPPPARLIRSTRTRPTVVSIQSPCRRTARF